MNYFKFFLLFIAASTIVSCSTSEFEEEHSLYEDTTEELTTSKLSASDFEIEVHQVVNDYRTSIGLNTLVFSETVYIDAEEHTLYMVSKGKLSHDKFNKRAEKIAKKTKAKSVSENVAKNYDTADEALEAWLNSSSHKNTIEGDFTHSSVSIKQDAEGNYYYTHIFFKK